jgi:hypothetical protein
MNIKEAGFTSKDIEKGLQLVANQLSKRTKMKVRLCKHKSYFANSNGEFYGIHFLVGDSSDPIELRLNMEKGTFNTNKITTFDIWYNVKNLQDVNASLEGYNILQVLEELSYLLVNPKEIENIREKVNRTDFNDWVNDLRISDEYLVNSKKIKLFKEYLVYLDQKQLQKVSSPTFNNILHVFLDKKGKSNIYNRLRKKKAKPDKKLLSPENQALLDFVENELENSIEDNLDDFKTDIKIVAKDKGNLNKFNSVVGLGPKGLGKTMAAQEALANVPKKDKGYIRAEFKSPGDFYKFLYNNRERIIIIDDSDPLIKKNSKFRVHLLAATDIGKARKLSNPNPFDSEMKSTNNPTGRYEQQFTFLGSLIFITNLPLNKIDEAFASRAYINVVEGSQESIFLMLEQNLAKWYPDVKESVRNEALQFLVDFGGWIGNIDFRMYGRSLTYFSSEDFEVAKVICLKKIKKGLL